VTTSPGAPGRVGDRRDRVPRLLLRGQRALVNLRERRSDLAQPMLCVIDGR
jgi:hypothetical protein